MTGPAAARPVHRVACIGEAMVELSLDPALETARIGFAGDALNTAVYLQRETRGALQVAFVSAIGTDALSDRMLTEIAEEGLVTAHLARHPKLGPGLYAIRTDHAGERQFIYWRDNSAARAMFDPGLMDPDQVLAGYDAVLLTATSYAILPAPAQTGLMQALRAFRQRGGLVVFDSNYRPRLWPDLSQARAAIEALWRICDIALPSVDDEMAIFGDLDEDQVVSRLQGWGIARGALKRGKAGPRSLGGLTGIPHFAAAETVVDTTAAGDSFNAGYLAALFTGKTEAEALAQGHLCAMQVIAHRGAIVPRDKWHDHR